MSSRAVLEHGATVLLGLSLLLVFLRPSPTYVDDAPIKKTVIHHAKLHVPAPDAAAPQVSAGTRITRHAAPAIVTAEDVVSQNNARVLVQDPLVLEFDDFVTQAEIDALLGLCLPQPPRRLPSLAVSRAVATTNEFSFDHNQILAVLAEPSFAQSTGGLERSVTSYRTSSTAWLMDDEMAVNATAATIVRQLEERIGKLVGLPVVNQEHFQVLRYNNNQYYRVHNDLIDEQYDMPCGPRVLTLFIYLNDVPAGGETSFTRLGLAVKPKKGKAVLWYSVTNDLEPEERTDHEARPVKQGTKYAANKWIHVGNFVDNWRHGNTG
ncbi:uncharacterized protein MONBRDRAFT_37507 [Monosiga brevicollis MX1]|uniref:Fe2OG dioxygenase domain-containing protein n=1 Tax=Monosiga brevicollis TaxID=81824 RepID=A9V256_MONBE|nr:uncharacterized protein MONBRDRAFT_37507 [Monosiga brevicollis MX1]EDQ88195.1 predicted protein [Monosiga brevicollis MX1]|eukprot:XP_001746788.1 hypothetical protein [Monosiga brevicollis MX1]